MPFLASTQSSPWCTVENACNFVLIDVEVGILLTFLASTKAKVRLYQKYMYPFLSVYTWKVSPFSSIHFQGLHLDLRIQKSPFWVFVFIISVYTEGQNGDQKFLCWKWSRVNAAKAKTLGYSNYTPWLWHLLKIIVLSDVTCRSVMEPCGCPFSLVLYH